MSFEFSETRYFTLRQSISGSLLPTIGWARVYYLNESTNTICIKEVQCTELSPKQTYDILETDSFQDEAQELGFAPTHVHKFYIAFPDKMRSGFRQVTEACRGLPSPTPTSVEAADSAIQAATGISLLSSPLMRELLLFIAIQCNLIRSRKIPRQAQAIATIASAGPPSAEFLTRDFRTYIDNYADGGGFLHPRAQAALLRGGWRPSQRGSLAALCGVKEDDFARDSHLQDDSRNLLDLLIELNYVGVAPGMADELLRSLAREGSVTVLRLLLGEGGVLPVETVPAELRADMLLNAVAAANDEKKPDRLPMIAYLLGEVGIDPNVQGAHSAGAKPGQGLIRQTALHVAMEDGLTEVVSLLLENGASMDARDEEGRTPSERGSSSR